MRRYESIFSRFFLLNSSKENFATYDIVSIAIGLTTAFQAFLTGTVLPTKDPR